MIFSTTATVGRKQVSPRTKVSVDGGGGGRGQQRMGTGSPGGGGGREPASGDWGQTDGMLGEKLEKLQKRRFSDFSLKRAFPAFTGSKNRTRFGELLRFFSFSDKQKLKKLPQTGPKAGSNRSDIAPSPPSPPPGGR